MAFRPTGSNVLIERIPAPKQSAGGIILKSSDEPDRAKIIAIGPDVTDVAVDEITIVNWNHARKIEDELYMIPITEIVMVIEED